MRCWNIVRMFSCYNLKRYTAYYTKNYVNNRLSWSQSQALAQPPHRPVNLIVLETVRCMMETDREKRKDVVQPMQHSRFQSRTPGRSATQLHHTAAGPLQTLEITLASARWGDRHLSWQELCQETQPLKPSAFHHCTKMTTHTCYFVWWRVSP